MLRILSPLLLLSIHAFRHDIEKLVVDNLELDKELEEEGAKSNTVRLSSDNKDDKARSQEITMMTLNVESYSELCDQDFHKAPDKFIDTNGELLDFTCSADCESVESKMNCCNDPSPQIKSACRAQKCYDTGTSNIWPQYKGKNDELELGEPLCVAAARKHFQRLVKDYNPHVVATQDDFENKPLQVEGYTTIISANSRAIHFFDEKGRFTELRDTNGRVNMVNALLVKTELFDKEETMQYCDVPEGIKPKAERDNFAKGQFDDTRADGVIRCGLNLRSHKVKEMKDKILSFWQMSRISVYVNDKDKGAGQLRKIGSPEDQAFLAARRCAAFAVIKSPTTLKPIFTAASVHLTGGFYDDNLIGLDSNSSQKAKDASQALSNEKEAQAEKLANWLTSNRPYPSIMLGDFNGPDKFLTQWWMTLRTQWPKVHPKVAFIFGNLANLQKMQAALQNKVVQTNFDLTWLGNERESREFFSQFLADAGYSKLQYFRDQFEKWMTGAHTRLRSKGWSNLASSDDYTTHFGHMMRPGEGGTTSKTGGVVDYTYASPGLIPFSPELQTQIGEDFSRAPKSAAELINVASAQEGSGSNPGVMVTGTPVKVTGYSVGVVPGVLRKISDHAPTVASIQFA